LTGQKCYNSANFTSIRLPVPLKVETIKNIPPIKLLVKKDQKRTNNKVNIIRWPFYETSLIFELFFLATYNIYLLYVA
jgi:hypothetical protein